MSPTDSRTADVARAVRDACVEALIRAYEDAGIQGLCGEGRWEYAVSAVRRLDVERVARNAAPGEGE